MRAFAFSASAPRSTYGFKYVCMFVGIYVCMCVCAPMPSMQNAQIAGAFAEQPSV